jgi:hypothetical protein
MKKIIILLISTFIFVNCYSQWEQKSNGMGTNKVVWSMVVSGNNVYAGTSGGVYISTNNGDNWTLSLSGQSGNSMLINGSSFFVGTDHGVFLSTNGGTNWSQTGLTTGSVWSFAIKDNYIFAGTSNLGIYISSNGGINWSHTAPSNIISSLAVSGNYVFAGDWAGPIVYASTDNGTSWIPRQTGGTFTDVILSLVVKDNILFAGADNSGVYKSTNNGLNWSHDILDVVGITCFTIKDNYLFAGDFFWGEVFLTSNNGLSWIPKGHGLGSSLSVWSLTVNNQYIFAGTDSSVWRRSYSEIIQTYTISGNVKYSDNNQLATGGYVKAIKIDRISGHIVTYDSTQIQSDGSYILSHVPQDSVDIGVYPNSTTQTDWVPTYYPSTIYWQSATTIYPTGNLTNINVSVFRLFPITATNSVNGRVVKINPESGLKDAMIYSKIGNSFVRYTSTDENGVYHLVSLPTGTQKIIVNRLGYSSDSVDVSLTPTSNIDSINFILNKIYIGIKQIGSTVPSEYKLYQNYPNPFNPSTNIRYQITNSKFVTLKVFNILGKEIATLVNEKQSAGTYEVTFDGGSLPSGIYFYRLQTGDFSEVKKMVLIK